MGRFRILIVAAVALLIGGGALYHFVFSPYRTTVVEGIRGPANARGIAPQVLSELPLVGEFPNSGLDIRVFRTRYWSVQPGGVFPIHSHDGRPATIYVVNGEIKEFRNGAEEPKVHRAGEVSAESQGMVHHWRNDSDEVVYLLASDIYGNFAARAEPGIEVSPAPTVEETGVSAEVLSTINLAAENIGADRGVLRTRRVTVAPGGRTSINAGGGTPFASYVLSGKVTFHQADIEGPFDQSEGANAIVRAGSWGWWENTSDVPATVIVTDISGLGASASVATEAAVFETQE